MSVTEDLEIRHYVEAVRAALSDLPARQRDDLLEDLPGHLAEVRAESGEPLERRLGPPEVYAAELRVAVGMVRGGRVPLRARMDAAVHRIRARRADVDRRAGVLLGYERGSDFLRLLRPAWWVLRGYLAAMIFAAVVSDDTSRLGLLPRADGGLLMGLFLLGSFVLGSIWLGRRETAGMARNPRRVMRFATAVLVVWSVGLLWQVDSRATVDQMVESYSTGYVPALPSEAEDVYVYDSNGRLLTDVRLYDQNGQPIDVGWDRCGANRPWTGTQVYPICPELAPFQVPAFPSPSESVPDGPAEGAPESRPGGQVEQAVPGTVTPRPSAS
ncbi:HAAS signaling domain-containing protein [Catenuloplanes atrovinosus]|uniref:Uncharacterized protein n=1 Tax=Catenuloplanes atrovinosus TaxID=137266 RepID=A0AAE3YST6_9ACTN|nr:hypothetical protein [Catenuloplanes atrovinosus]MDR7279308.1 hypothetical protein [Catenuloplanes atrovinosus]